MKEAPLYWIKQIQKTLIETQTIPLFGYPPIFPWEKFSQKVGIYLQSSELKITPRKIESMPAEAWTSGFGINYLTIALELTPLIDPVFWIMGKEEIAKLIPLALLASQGNKGFSSAKFQEGFYYFLATQVLIALDDLKPYGDLSPKMSKFSGFPPGEEALCIDVEIHHPKTTLWGRLICPLSFHRTFKSHFATQPPPPLTSAFVQHIDVTVRLELGQTTLPLSQWEKISVGDFILLDRCTFDPKSQKGTVILLLENTPLFRARIKDSHIKLVDYAFYQQEPSLMNFETPPEEENPHEFLPPSDIEPEADNQETPLWSVQNQARTTEQMISTKDIPLLLTVEVAKLKMNLGQLLQLTPGNVLELPVKPEQGVDITIDGKKIAKAELIKLGDMIGIKILQLG